jgi:formate dehydrogenase subunit delta
MSHDEAHAMNTGEKLVYMANQIASFFKAMPHDEAVPGIAKHINDFWDPRMRRQFFEMVDAGGDFGFSPLVIEAATTIRRPAAVEKPASAA